MNNAEKFIKRLKPQLNNVSGTQHPKCRDARYWVGSEYECGYETTVTFLFYSIIFYIFQLL